MGRSAWAFDVDGCVLDSMSATSVRPLVLDVLSQLRTSGVPVVVWSAGGADYARRVVTRAGLDHFVQGFYEKVRGSDGRWLLDEFADHHRPSTCVDDDPEGVPAGIRVLAVPPYIAENPHNRGFAHVLAAALAEASRIPR
jgi:hypothetical protein